LVRGRKRKPSDKLVKKRTYVVSETKGRESENNKLCGHESRGLQRQDDQKKKNCGKIGGDGGKF